MTDDPDLATVQLIIILSMLDSFMSFKCLGGLQPPNFEIDYFLVLMQFVFA